MVELRYRQKRFADAYVWAGVYSHYRISGYERRRQQEKEKAENGSVFFALYAAALVRRCEDRLDGDGQRKQALDADVVAFVEKHGERIDAALRSMADASATSTVRMLRSGRMDEMESRRLHATVRQSGLLVFLSGINAEGKVDRVLVVDGLPLARSAKSYQRLAQGSLYDRKPGSSGLLWQIHQFEMDREGTYYSGSSEN